MLTFFPVNLLTLVARKGVGEASAQKILLAFRGTNRHTKAVFIYKGREGAVWALLPKFQN